MSQKVTISEFFESARNFADFINGEGGGIANVAMHLSVHQAREAYYNNHEYDADTLDRYVTNYLLDEANKACLIIYDYAKEKALQGDNSIIISFAPDDLSSDGGYYGCDPWYNSNIVSPKDWCYEHYLGGEEQLCPLMAMGLCYCCAVAFQDYGFYAEPVEECSGQWNLEISWAA